MANKLWVGGSSGAPGDWDTAANWSPSGVPEDDDNVTLKNSSQDIDEGLDQSAVRLAVLNIEQSYTGKITDTDDAFLQISADEINIGLNTGVGSPTGSQKIKLALGTNASGEDVPIVNVFNTGTPDPSTYLPAVELTGEFNLNVRKGSVGGALGIGETATIAELRTSYVTNKETDVSLTLGSGVTLIDFIQTGGTNVIRCGVTTLEVILGTLTSEGSGAIGTVDMNGGVFKPHSTGTITTMNLDSGHANFLGSTSERTVTTLNISGDGQLSVNPELVTIGTLAIAETVVIRASGV